MEPLQNIVVITTDQHRADVSRREGFAVDTTPALDRLAEHGRWFDRAYTCAPVCVPARVSLLTGRYPSAHGVRENYGYDAPRYTADLMNVAAAAGYRTAVIGKNHSHLTPDRVDYFSEYGHLGRIPGEAAAAADREFDAWLRQLGFATSMSATPFPVERQLPCRIVDEAISFLSAGQGDRTLIWLSIPEPHVPYQVPAPYFDDYGPQRVPMPATSRDDLAAKGFAWTYTAELSEWSNESDPAVLRRARANYLGMLRLVDDQINRFVEYLDGTGQRNRTLIVFVADHGDFAGEYGLMRKGPGLPEVLTRIPMFINGPGISGGRSTAHVSIVDVLPTLCEIMGQPLPAGVQGRSLVSLLRGDDETLREFDSAYAEQGVGGLPYTPADMGKQHPGLLPKAGGRVTVDTLNAVTQGGSARMVRSGRYKLTQDVSGRTQLFDLVADPYELTDLSGRDDLAAVELGMLRRLATWSVRVADPLPIPPDGYPRKVGEHNYYWNDEEPW